MTKEEKRVYAAAWRIKNLESVRASSARYYAANRDKIAAHKLANPEKRRAWELANRDKRKAAAKTYEAVNKGRRRAYRREKNYGLSLEAFQLMLSEQGGACGICGEPFLKEPRVDHNHKTNKIRGLLCHQCNVGLGNFRDSRELLECARNYLRLRPELR